jgi:acetyl esterase/lipase
MRLTSLIVAVAIFAACTSSIAVTPVATPAPTTAPSAVATAVPTAVPPPVVYRDDSFEVKVTDGVTYGKALVHRRAGEVGTAVDLTLDVYEPIDAGDAPRPAIIIVHGGGFDFNDSKSNAFPLLWPLLRLARVGGVLDQLPVER